MVIVWVLAMIRVRVCVRAGVGVRVTVRDSLVIYGHGWKFRVWVILWVILRLSLCLEITLPKTSPPTIDHNP